MRCHIPCRNKVHLPLQLPSWAKILWQIKEAWNGLSLETGLTSGAQTSGCSLISGGLPTKPFPTWHQAPPQTQIRQLHRHRRHPLSLQIHSISSHASLALHGPSVADIPDAVSDAGMHGPGKIGSSNCWFSKRGHCIGWMQE